MSSLEEELSKLGGNLREYRAECTPIISAEMADEMGISLNELARIELKGPNSIDELLSWIKAMNSVLEKKYGPPSWWVKIPGVAPVLRWISDFISGEK